MGADYKPENWFEVGHETQTIVEIPVKPMDGRSHIPWDWEIIQPFLDHHSLTPIWIDCHYVWGWPDETGAWTGAVGKVRNLDFELHTYSFDIIRLRGMRQTGQYLILAAPMAGVRLLCVHMLLSFIQTTGGRDILRRPQNSGT